MVTGQWGQDIAHVGVCQGSGGSSQPNLSIILRAEPAPAAVRPTKAMVQAGLGGSPGCSRKLSVEYRTVEKSSVSPLGPHTPLP